MKNQYSVKKSDIPGYFKVICNTFINREKVFSFTYTELTSEKEANEKAEYLNSLE